MASVASSEMPLAGRSSTHWVPTPPFGLLSACMRRRWSVPRVQVETGPGRVGSEGAHGRRIRRGAAQSGGDVRRRVLRNRAAAEHPELRCGGAGTARRDVGARGRDAEADDDGREGAAEGNARSDASGGLSHAERVRVGGGHLPHGCVE